MANSWFRLYAEFATDPKVQMLSESHQRRLVMVFCMRCNGDVTLHDEEVAFQLRISNEEWADTKAVFMAKGFIDDTNEVLNWDKRQFVSDSSAERVAKHREKKKQACNVTVTPPDTEQNRTDTEQKKEEPSQQAAPEPPVARPPSKKFQLDALVSLGAIEQHAIDWLEVRKKKRAPAVNPSVIDGVRREAAKAGISFGDAVRICAEKGWQSFDSTWNWGGTMQKSSVQDARLAVAEHIFRKGNHGNNSQIIDVESIREIEGDRAPIPTLGDRLR
jgi:hypothetical protein